MLFSVVFAVQRHPLFCFSDFIAIRHFAVGRRITQGPGLPDPRPRATGPAGPMLSEMHRGARRRALVGVAVVDQRQWTSSLPRVPTTVTQETAAAISPLPPARRRRRYGRLLLLAAAIPARG